MGKKRNNRLVETFRLELADVEVEMVGKRNPYLLKTGNMDVRILIYQCELEKNPPQGGRWHTTKNLVDQLKEGMMDWGIVYLLGHESGAITDRFLLKGIDFCHIASSLSATDDHRHYKVGLPDLINKSFPTVQEFLRRIKAYA